jgi:hypothetical protein
MAHADCLRQYPSLFRSTTMSHRHMDRRKFLATSLAASCALLSSPRGVADTGRGPQVRLSVHPDKPGNAIATDFTGLSYETSQLSDPSFFSPENTALAAFHRRLGAAGVLRIGGNTSEFSVWTPTSAPVRSASQALGPDTGRHPPPRRPITPLAVRNLRGFLELSGWRLIYGLNMGTESPETAADEAACVASVMGDKLVAFQLCNEPDLFHKNGLRGPDYGYRQFTAQWRRYFRAVRQRVPRAPFSGPDTADNDEWLARFASEQRHDVTFLSEHYYAEGPPTDPSMTLTRLLGPSAKLDAELEAAAAARRNTGLPFRMTETNSCYGGGKPGVSDTFAAALWAADLMYRLAQAGASGVNFHGGGYGWYTPVAGTPESGFVARPLYYGMLLFAAAGAGRLVRTEMDGVADGSLTALGLKSRDGALKAVVLNRSLDADVTLAVDAPGARAASVMRLLAPRPDDRTDVTFAGSVVGNDGRWMPAVTETLTARQGLLTLRMPRASGAVLMLS